MSLEHPITKSYIDDEIIMFQQPKPNPNTNEITQTGQSVMSLPHIPMTFPGNKQKVKSIGAQMEMCGLIITHSLVMLNKPINTEN